MHSRMILRDQLALPAYQTRPLHPFAYTDLLKPTRSKSVFRAADRRGVLTPWASFRRHSADQKEAFLWLA